MIEDPSIRRSILNTVKKLNHIDVEDPSFDDDLIIHINSAIFDLEQVGVVPPEGFLVTGPSEEWTMYLNGRTNLEVVKSCIYLKVRLMFDPPANSFLVESINKQIEQMVWRIREQTEQGGV